MALDNRGRSDRRNDLASLALNWRSRASCLRVPLYVFSEPQHRSTAERVCHTCDVWYECGRDD